MSRIAIIIEMSKKAQITVFIIIGIVLLIFAGIVLYYNLASKEAGSEIESVVVDTSPMRSFIESCLQTTLTKAIDYVSLQGGFYHTPEDYIINLGYTIPYYHDVVKGDLMISLADIEKQISYYIEDNINDCIDNFSVFKELGYQIEAGDKNIISNINDAGVSVDMIYPLTIQLDDDIAELDSFSAYSETQFQKIYGYIRKYIDKQMTVPNAEPLSYLMMLADEYDFKFENIFRNDSCIYALNIDDPTEEIPYVFVFAVKYDWSSLGI